MIYFILIILRRNGYNNINTIIIGYNEDVEELIRYFNENKLAGYHLFGIFFHKVLNISEYIGNYDAIKSFLQKNKVHEMYLAVKEIPNEYKTLISSIISTNAIKLRFIPFLYGFSRFNIELIYYDLAPVIHVKRGPLSKTHNIILKRIIDIIISLTIVLGILIWLIPLMYLIIRIFGEKKLFFIQKRSGLNNKTFNCIKFRTLNYDIEQASEDASNHIENMTKVGKFLRKTNLDELPQFINVLFNQMSVIGPRPHMTAHTEKYKFLVEKFMFRQMIKPGITGLAQIRGFRGHIKNNAHMEERVKLDLNYIEKWSVFLEIKIFFATIWLILTGLIKTNSTDNLTINKVSE